jgi:hypothetical protein
MPELPRIIVSRTSAAVGPMSAPIVRPSAAFLLTQRAPIHVLPKPRPASARHVSHGVNPGEKPGRDLLTPRPEIEVEDERLDLGIGQRPEEPKQAFARACALHHVARDRLFGPELLGDARPLEALLARAVPRGATEHRASEPAAGAAGASVFASGRGTAARAARSAAAAWPAPAPRDPRCSCLRRCPGVRRVRENAAT